MLFLSNIPLLVLFFEDIFFRCSISCNNCSWRAFCSSFDGSCSLEVPPKSASVLLVFRGLSWRLLASSFVVCFCASFRKAWTSSFGIWQAVSQVCPFGLVYTLSTKSTVLGCLPLLFCRLSCQQDTCLAAPFACVFPF